MVNGWWKTAKPGDKIVCVSNGVWIENSLCGRKEIEVGKVYTVKDIEPCNEFRTGFGVVLQENGWVNLYGVMLFRPVQTKSTETGMAILRKLLTGKRVKA